MSKKDLLAKRLLLAVTCAVSIQMLAMSSVWAAADTSTVATSTQQSTSADASQPESNEDEQSKKDSEQESVVAPQQSLTKFYSMRSSTSEDNGIMPIAHMAVDGPLTGVTTINGADLKVYQANYNMAFGQSANAVGRFSSAFGAFAKAETSNSSAFGAFAKASHVNSVAIGANTLTTADYQVSFGGNDYINGVDFTRSLIGISDITMDGALSGVTALNGVTVEGNNTNGLKFGGNAIVGLANTPFSSTGFSVSSTGALTAASIAGSSSTGISIDGINIKDLKSTVDGLSAGGGTGSDPNAAGIAHSGTVGADDSTTTIEGNTTITKDGLTTTAGAIGDVQFAAGGVMTNVASINGIAFGNGTIGGVSISGGLVDGVDVSDLQSRVKTLEDNGTGGGGSGAGTNTDGIERPTTGNTVIEGSTTIDKDGISSGHINADRVVVAEGKDKEVTIDDKGIHVGAKPSLTKDADAKANVNSTDIDSGEIYLNKDGDSIAVGSSITGLQSDVRDLDSRVSSLDNRVSRMGNEIKEVGALGAALAGLHPLPEDANARTSMAMAIGSYEGKQAVAVGGFYRPNRRTMLSVGGSFTTSKQMFNMGVSFALDRMPERQYQGAQSGIDSHTLQTLLARLDNLETNNKKLEEQYAELKTKYEKEIAEKKAAQDKDVD